jgi:cell division protein FtsL
MLIHSRKVWYLSLVLGVLSMLQLAKTSYKVHHENTSIEMKIGEIAKRYEDLRAKHEKNGADARLIKELDPTGSILRSIQK